MLSIGTKIPQDASTFKQTLDALPAGTTITATTIAGDFVLPLDASTPLLLIAGGIGITPFASQLAEQSTVGNATRDIIVIYSVTDNAEISYRAVLENSSARIINVSPAPLDRLPVGWEHVSGTRVDQAVIEGVAADIADREVFVSGPPAMVAGVGTAARRLGAAAVTTDYFSGY